MWSIAFPLRRHGSGRGEGAEAHISGAAGKDRPQSFFGGAFLRGGFPCLPWARQGGTFSEKPDSAGHCGKKQKENVLTAEAGCLLSSHTFCIFCKESDP